MIDHLGTGGAETHVIQLVQNLDPDQYEITLVCLRNEGYRYDTVQQANVEKVVCHISNILRPAAIKAVFTLSQLVRRKNIEIIHTYIFNPTVIGTLVKMIANKNVKLITTRRDTGFWHSQKHWFVYKMINRFADRIVCVCHAVSEMTQTQERIPARQLETIYNGIDLTACQLGSTIVEQARQQYSIPSHALVIGMVAIFRPEKRHDLFIDAAIALLQRNSDSDRSLYFMVVGDGDETIKQAIKQKIQDAGLSEYFILTGLLADVKPAMALLDIMVLCSDYEAMSNALIEAMAMGKPVVATHVGGNVELIEDGCTGLLIEKGSCKGLEDALMCLIHDDEKRQKISTAARQFAENTFDLDVMVKKTASLYQRLLNPSPTVASSRGI